MWNVLKMKSWMKGKNSRGAENSNKEVKKLGSSPPSCAHKCYGCVPCEAIQVPTTKGRVGVQYANYEPEGWKCKCGPTFYTPWPAQTQKETFERSRQFAHDSLKIPFLGWIEESHFSIYQIHKPHVCLFITNLWWDTIICVRKRHPLWKMSTSFL